MPKDYHLHLRGSVGDWKFDSEYTSYILDKYKDQEVNVLISSLGGRADSGLTINSLFKIHGNVHVHFISMNASAATIAAMGAKRITIDSGACFLVHKCLNAVCDWDWKNADQLEARIAELQKLKDDLNAIDSVVAGIYARRCKKTKDEMMALMKTGGWLTPQEALEWGFVDEITDLAEDEKPVLTEAVASAICAAGIPMPPLEMEKDSFFARLRKFFMSESSGNPAPINSTPPPPPEKNPTSDTHEDNTVLRAQPEVPENTIDMKKFPLLAALLGVAIAAEGDTAFSPKAEDIQKIEDALAAKDKALAEAKAQAEADKVKIDELTKTVADLKKAPAAGTSEVNEQSKADTDGPGDDVDAIVAEFAKAFCS